MTTFWSLWIIIITVGTLVGCAAILIWCLKDKTGIEEGADMGHEYDGIRELNKCFKMVDVLICRYVSLCGDILCALPWHGKL